ncbi:hypothetical protein GCM10011348_45700 [Marinobacterium nitratireducens]|uniref:Formyl transferase N-terminal domain-containing protein n=1 Tax=Marinobacterium nitratireducens TaxID=518897 RepID=A0A917ZRV8_9GAMM|nr:formyltransferase family protein [Marinobacterium nitratireducens]GGO88991.1 hypothetical protein GCM10011348_45700 [Marinobacterium nitratireducens]
MTDTILFLGPEDSPLISWLQSQGEVVIQTADKISSKFIRDSGASFIISYGYRHILRADVLDLFPSRAINLHISYLPWNRGADPNLWSFVDNTPKGVTIHYLDEGVDTGDIIAQEVVRFDLESDTLATSYEKLHKAIQLLFKANWSHIKDGTCQRQNQSSGGTIHKIKDKSAVDHLITDGWNTRVSAIAFSKT